MSKAGKALIELTEREHEVMMLAIEGRSNKEIANSLGISHRTVETHKARVLRKMGVGTVLDLILSADEKLKNDARELNDLYQNAPCGYHSIDAEGTIIRINDTELAWLGYTRSEVVGIKKIVDFLTPECVDVFAKEFPIFKETGRLCDLRLDMVRKDGSIFPVMLNASVIHDAQGNYWKSRSTVVDMTHLLALQQQESEYQKLNALYRAVVEDFTEIVSRIRADGTLVFVNSAYASFLASTRKT